MTTLERDLPPLAGRAAGAAATMAARIAVPPWLRAVLAIATVAGLVRLVFPDLTLGFDQMYALIWGRELGDGGLPDYDVASAPTAHPLPVLVAALASLAGSEAAYDLLVAVAYLSLAALLYAVFHLGRLTFSWPVGVLAALLVGTSEPILSRGLSGYLDVPFVTLVVFAAILEVRRPRRGGAVLVVLAVAGLIRPEGWVLAGAYWLYLAPSLGWGARARAAALVVAAPLLWAVMDLVVTGSAVYATTDAREAGRAFGADRVSVPDRWGDSWDALRDILRLPALAAGLLGASIAIAVARRRAFIPGALVALGMATFAALVVVRLPTADRFLFLPAVMLALLGAFAILGWLEREHGPARRAWASAGALLLVVVVATAPTHVSRLDRLEGVLAGERRVDEGLRALTRAPNTAALLARCSPITVPTHQPQPALAYYLGRPPAEIRSAELRPPVKGAFVAPANASVAALALSTASHGAPDYEIPVGFRRAAGNASWTIYARGC